MRVSISHYKVGMSVEVDGHSGCCGVSLIYNFDISGEDCDLTKDQANAMYTELMIKIRDCTDRCIILASDALPEFMEDEESAWFSSDYTRGEVCSLVEFCRYHGFKESPASYNGNTGNGVAVFTLSISPYLYNGNHPRVAMPKLPDFSDDTRVDPPCSAEVEEVLEKIRDLIGDSGS